MIAGLSWYLSVIGIYLSLSLLSYLYKSRIFWFIGLFYIFFFACFKDIISPDFVRYAYTYENIENFNMLVFEVFEPVFFLLSKLAPNYYFLFFYYEFLTLLLILLGIKNLAKHIEFSFFIYLCIPGLFLNTFVEMRQSLAVAVFFYAVSLFLMNKKLLAYIFFIFSCITHYSAVFAVLTFFLYNFFYKKLKIKAFILIIVLFFILFVFTILNIDYYYLKFISLIISLIPFFSKYSGYIEAAISGNMESLSYQTIKNLFFAVWFFILWYFFKKTSIKNHSVTYYNIWFLMGFYLLGVIILILTGKYSDISRIAYYFLVFLIILIPEVFSNIKIEKSIKFLIYYITLITFLLLFIKGVFYYSIEANTYIFLNYKNILIEAILE